MSQWQVGQLALRFAIPWMGSPVGSYKVLGPFSAGNSPYAAVGDLNFDGTPDLAVANCFSNNAVVLFDGTQRASAAVRRLVQRHLYPG
jgi:hypothetical protein